MTAVAAAVIVAHLADHHLVLVVVASQVGQDAGGARHHVDVVTAKQLDQSSQQPLHSLLQREQKSCFLITAIQQLLSPSEAVVTCLVAASDKFLRVHRQFWTSLWLGSVRWSPSACMPPAEIKNTRTKYIISVFVVFSEDFTG